MDMSLPEQLVWAAAYARREHDVRLNNQHMSPEDRVLDASVIATMTVMNMRAGFKHIAGNDALKQMMGRQAFDHLRQMTYKSED